MKQIQLNQKTRSLNNHTTELTKVTHIAILTNVSNLKAKKVKAIIQQR